MSVLKSIDPSSLRGLEPDMLSFDQRLALAGRWIAVDIYTPRTLPVRRIVVVGESAVDCARQLAEQGEDPSRYEYQRVPPAC